MVPNLLIFVLMLNGGGTCIYTSRTRKQKTEGLIDGTGGTCIPVNRLNSDLVDSVPRTLLNSPVFTIILLYIARSITLRFFSSKYQWYKDQMWHEWHCSSFLIETKYPPQWANPNIFILTFFCVLKVHCYCKNRSKR